MNFVVLIREKFFKNPLLAGSLIMVFGSNIYNAGQFLYHILAGRILGAANYGDLAVLVNILAIFGLVQSSLGLTVVKFIASEKDEEKIKGLVRWALLWSLLLGGIIAAVIVLLAPIINEFFKIRQYNSIFLLVPTIIFYAVILISRSVLQGLLKFQWYVVSLLGEIGIKLILIVPLVHAGWMVFGAIGALLCGIIFSFFISILPLKKYLLKVGKSVSPNPRPLFLYIFPSFVQGIALTLMYSTDLFLVKHFFPAEEAGLYAGLAKLGTIVFFATGPISQVMFPLIAKKQAHGEAYHKIFYLSLLLVIGLSGSLVSLYFLFPSLILSVWGDIFLAGSKILWWFGLFMSLLAVASLFIQFYLSIGKTFVVGLFLTAAALQALLIWNFHSSLIVVIQMSIISAALLILALSIYFPYHDRKKG